MQANSVSIAPEMLNWVIAHIQMNSLPKQIVEHLTAWISGQKEPTFNQIEKVSRATGIPLGYFFLEQPPKEDVSFVEYRTVDSIQLENPSRNLIDIMHDMDQVQEWMHDYLFSTGSPTMEYVGALQKEQSYEIFAQYVRSLLDLPIDWYKESKNEDASFSIIRKAISNKGTIVMMSGIVGNNTHRPLSIDEFRAFSITDDYAPLIFINSNDSVNGKLFSLLHEFAHICIGENSLFNDRYSTGEKVKKAETLCNAVAAEILVPQKIFIQEWNVAVQQNEQEQAVNTLARNFKCGVTVIARKAYDNGFIGYDLYRKISKLAVQIYNDHRKRMKERGESGGDYYRTAASRIDQRFFRLLISSVYEGKTLYSDAFRLTNTNRSTFTNLVESVGGGLK